MKWDFKNHLFALAMIVSLCLAAVYFSYTLPDTVPSHFNIDGIADKWSSKSDVVFLGIAAPVGVFVILTFIPLIDPFWKRIQNKYNLFLVFRDISIGFIVYFSIVGYVSAREGTLATNMVVLGIGLLFMFLGNYLPKLPRNFFFGVRTPWTLASEQVWKRTHHISGWLFVASGLVMAILSFSRLSQYAVLLAVLIPLVLFCGFVYPYFLYHRLEREGEKQLPQL
jgi:uncharacterized membrane protein